MAVLLGIIISIGMRQPFNLWFWIAFAVAFVGLLLAMPGLAWLLSSRQ